MRTYWNENAGAFAGIALEEPTFSHENHGEDYFRIPLAVDRLSGARDILPLTVSRSQLEAFSVHAGDSLRLEGELRSFNNRSGVGKRLVLSVFVRRLARGEGEMCNRVTLAGALCRAPVYRRTPMGREICDLTLAVNRRYGRSDYLPCITWGAVARRCRGLGVGAGVALEGRFQSRVYTKRLEDGVVERTAYEVSAMELELLEPGAECKVEEKFLQKV